MTRMDKNLEAQMSSTGENGHLFETIAGIGEVVADVYEVGGEAFSMHSSCWHNVSVGQVRKYYPR